MRKKCARRMAALILAVVFAVGCLVGCAKQQPVASKDVASSEQAVVSLSDTLELGAKYLGELNYASAIIQYTAALSLDTKNCEALAGLYTAYVASGQNEQADELFAQSEQTLGDDSQLLPFILQDADLLSENGGGTGVYQSLAEQYLGRLDEENSISSQLSDIGTAWTKADSENPAAYVPLSVLYGQQNDEEKLTELTQLAQENGVELKQINISIEKLAGEDYVVTMDLVGSDEMDNDDMNVDEMDNDDMNVEELAGEGYVVTMDLTGGDETDDSPVHEEVEVVVTPETTPEEVSQQVTSQAADNAAQAVVEESGLDPESPEGQLAMEMAQQALQEGLGALADGDLSDYGF